MKPAIAGGVRPASAQAALEQRLRLVYDLMMARRFIEAEQVCRGVLAVAPNHAVALDMFGVILRAGRDDPIRALPYLQRSVAADPRRAPARLHLASVYMAWQRFAAAAVEVKAALKLEPKSIEGLCYLAICSLNLGKPDEAIALFRRALALAPNDPTLLIDAAAGFVAVGDPAEANRLYRRAKAHREAAAGAIYRLVELGPKAGPVPTLAEVESHLADPRANLDDQMKLHQAAGLIEAGNRHYDEAFAHFLKGKSVYVHTYNPQMQRAFTDGLIAAYTPEFFAARAGYGDPSRRPIFIIGMPRSGTSLIEQMLASHPKIAGGGELPDMLRLAQPLFDIGGGRTYASRLHALARGEYTRLAADYLSVLQSISPDADRVTDKMPDNYKQAGLIALMFPNATIIHMKRDPLDNCVSCLTTVFVGGRHAYAGSLETLGEYYRLYQRLMAHWHAVLPGRIVDVQYEELVADPETQLRRVLDRCGLEWDPAVLKFNESGREVQTASHLQVKRPLYSSSVGRWQVYDAHLGPLKAALGLTATGPVAAAPDA